MQNIEDDISFGNLPANWQGFNFSRFSKGKTLFDFQQDALGNALKALHLYFKDKNQDKNEISLRTATEKLMGIQFENK